MVYFIDSLEMTRAGDMEDGLLMKSQGSSQEQSCGVEFDQLGLDDRLVKALGQNGFKQPTLIQEKTIPLGLSGKDLLAKAKTGSGKTLAFLLPILHRILVEETFKRGKISGLILVPTKDLAGQIEKVARSLTAFCPKELRIANIATEESFTTQQSLLKEEPVLVVSTPSRIVPHLEAKSIVLEDLKMLAIDEADLVLGFGYGQDFEKILSFLPTFVQTILMSASITSEVEQLKQLLLRQAVIVRLEEGTDGFGHDPKHLKQYVIEISNSEDKFLLIYVVLKLGLLKGKMLVFVNEVERAYRVKLFLEQFGIKSCVLNAELPLLSRHHIVEEFNRGIYDILIASDTATWIKQSVPDGINDSEATPLAKKGGDKTNGKKRRQRTKDNEFGVSRGVDFKRVDVVINFDFAPSPSIYLHRAGRTARNGEVGTVISFIDMQAGQDYEILEAINKEALGRGGQEIPPFLFDFNQIDGFRYRTQDAMRAVTKALIKEARLKDVRKELINSEKLSGYFAERPQDLYLLSTIGAGSVAKSIDSLKHEKILTDQSKLKPYLKHVPEYLLRSTRSKEAPVGTDDATGPISSLPQHEPKLSNRAVKREKYGNQSSLKKAKAASTNPLKSFKSSNRKK